MYTSDLEIETIRELAAIKRQYEVKYETLEQNGEQFFCPVAIKVFVSLPRRRLATNQVRPAKSVWSMISKEDLSDLVLSGLAFLWSDLMGPGGGREAI